MHSGVETLMSVHLHCIVNEALNMSSRKAQLHPSPNALLRQIHQECHCYGSQNENLQGENASIIAFKVPK